MNKSASPTRNGDTSSNNPNAAALSAALKGATLAFNKQKAANATENKATPLRPSPHRNSVSSAGGALLAATQAARDYSALQSRPRSPESVNRHETGGSVGLQDREEGGGNDILSTTTAFLSPPSVGRPSSDHGKQSSASFIAATLAASRSTSPIPPTNASASRGGASGTRRQSVGAASILSASSSLGLGPTDAPDTESIKPTTSLVSLFERKMGEDMDPVKREPAVRTKSNPEPSRRESPAPELVQTGDQEPEQQRQKAKPKPKPKPKPQITPGDDMTISSGSGKVDDNPSAAKEKAGSGKDVSRELAAQSKAQDGPPVRPKSRNKPQKAERTVPTPPPERVPNHEPKEIRSSTPPPLVSSSATTEVVSPQPIKLVKTSKLEPPIVPPPRRSTIKEVKTPTAEVTERDPTENRVRRGSHSSVSSDDTFVSASSSHSPRAATPTITASTAPAKPEPPAPRGSQPRRRKSLETLPAAQPPTSRRPSAPRISAPNIALDSLTNAIVASNLAASRLTASTSPNPPLPPPTRRHGNQHRPQSPLQPQRTAESLSTHYTGNGGSRSPNRKNQRTGMLQTLRAPPTSLSDDEDVRRRMDRHNRRGKLRHLPGKHHAHHEGSRRRWRDEVSARERRRYEAVWASNRGLFLQPGWSYSGDGDYQQQIEASKAREGAEADWVASVVVKDIWGRSRLPEDELSEVWQLVDQGGKGALARDEFVVGMWLIDQRLRGRKIPARVGASVWDSVRGGGAGRVVVPDPKAARRDKGGRGKK
ncbi:increased rDNA silencing protein 4 [Cladorrhinum sp. PSN332]|nr:increased rDNA silencing protein 4 [Cladorrhinum sp. PSN332]